MMSMMAEEAEPVGFIFDPTDSEIVTYYLQRMADGDHNLCRFPPGFIYSIDIYECEPWNLLPPDEFKHGPSRNQAFFFTPRHRAGTTTTTAASNKHHARRTVTGGGGFWHGKAHEVHIRQLGESGPIVGRKTSLNFKTRDGLPTDWIMQEYLLGRGGGGGSSNTTPFQSVALCKIYKKLHGRREMDDLQEPEGIPLLCYKKQQADDNNLQIADAEADDDVLPPPCKKQRRLPHNDLQLLEGDEEVEVLPEEEAAADRPHNDDQMFDGLAARLLGEEEETALPAAANELFASFTQLLKKDKEEEEEEDVGVLHAEAAADHSHDHEWFASLAAQLLEKEEVEEEMTLPAAGNASFASFNQLLDGDKKEEVVVVPAPADNEEEEALLTLDQLFRDEDMLTQYDDFCIDDYLCLENYVS